MNSSLPIILTRLAGLSALVVDQTFTTSINTLFPNYGPKILAGIGIVAFVAADLLHAQALDAKS
jgi:hypothetical protein